MEFKWNGLGIWDNVKKKVAKAKVLENKTYNVEKNVLYYIVKATELLEKTTWKKTMLNIKISFFLNEYCDCDALEVENWEEKVFILVLVVQEKWVGNFFTDDIFRHM